MTEAQPQYDPVPPDDLNRTMASANPDHEGKLPHIGLVGDTYTIAMAFSLGFPSRSRTGSGFYTAPMTTLRQNIS